MTTTHAGLKLEESRMGLLTVERAPAEQTVEVNPRCRLCEEVRHHFAPDAAEDVPGPLFPPTRTVPIQRQTSRTDDLRAFQPMQDRQGRQADRIAPHSSSAIVSDPSPDQRVRPIRPAHRQPQSSRSIYLEIDYRPVSEVVDYRFSDTEPADSSERA